MGRIYLITNNVNGNKYVGQTTGTIEERFKQHIYQMTRYAKHLIDPDKYVWNGTCTYLYKAMKKYGFESFTVEQIVEVNNDELDENEIKFILELDTLAPNGYNLTTGGGYFQHCDLTKKLISEKVKDIMLNNIDNFRSSEKTKGMPPYVAYANRDKYEAYYVNNHPLCKRKYFSASTYGTIENAKLACVEFVNELNIANIPHVVEGQNGAPIKGLRTTKHGYQVRKTIKGTVHKKSFNDKKLTREENLANATKYIESLK